MLFLSIENSVLYAVFTPLHLKYKACHLCLMHALSKLRMQCYPLFILLISYVHSTKIFTAFTPYATALVTNQRALRCFLTWDRVGA